MSEWLLLLNSHGDLMEVNRLMPKAVRKYKVGMKDELRSMLWRGK